MPDDPREKYQRKTPPEGVARAMTTGARGMTPSVPRDFAPEARQPITGVGLEPFDELNERAKRLQTTTDATRLTVTGQLESHGKEIASLKSDVGEVKISMATVAGQMPLLTTAVQELTAAAIQRETVTTTTMIEVSGAKQIADIDVEKAAKKAKIERGTKFIAIVSTLLAIGLALLEALR